MIFHKAILTTMDRMVNMMAVTTVASNGRALLLRIWSGRRGSNPQHPAWESELPSLYFHHLQNRSGKINVHATLTVHAVPDLRVAAGRFAGRFLAQISINSET